MKSEKIIAQHECKRACFKDLNGVIWHKAYKGLKVIEWKTSSYE